MYLVVFGLIVALYVCCCCGLFDRIWRTDGQTNTKMNYFLVWYIPNVVNFGEYLFGVASFRNVW